jgi:Uma2 family endonuclease
MARKRVGEPMTQSLGNMTVMEFDVWVAGADDDRAFELVDGVPLPIGDAGEAHEQIASNLGANLKQAMDKRGYRTYQEGIMVQASASPAERNKFRPDVVVRCGSLSDNTFISDPIVVIEVVSPSTVDLDLGRKLQFYRELPTVRHVVLAYEDRKQVEHHRRTETDWERTVLTKQGSVLVLDAVEFSMDLNGIYFDVSL